MRHDGSAEILTALMAGCTIHFNDGPTDSRDGAGMAGILWREASGRFRVLTDEAGPGSSVAMWGDLETLDDAAACQFLVSLIAQPSLSIGVGDSSDTDLLRGDDVPASRFLADLEQAALPIGLHAAANRWTYRKPDLWRVLVVEKRLGSFQSRFLRSQTGVRLPDFYPDLTSNPVPAPEALPLLLRTVDRLAAAESRPVDQFIARLVRQQVRKVSDRVIYIEAERKFYLEDLEPTLDELAAWKSIAPRAVGSLQLAT